jgi:hypothetical protein
MELLPLLGPLLLSPDDAQAGFALHLLREAIRIRRHSSLVSPISFTSHPVILTSLIILVRLLIVDSCLLALYVSSARCAPASFTFTAYIRGLA